MRRAILALLGIGLCGPGCVDLSGLMRGSGAASTRSGDLGDAPAQENETGDGPAETALPDAGTISARVRNFTDLSADVTLRFLLNGVVVHLSFLRVPSRTSTTVIGPDLADRLEASGVDQNGEPLPDAVFVYGVDFLEGTQAEYVIGGEIIPGNIPPTLTFIQPAGGLRVAAGDVFDVVIQDDDPDSSATIAFMLDPDGQPLNGNELLLLGGLSEDADEEGDEFALAIPEGVGLGQYRLIAVISDGVSTDIVPAPGVIEVVGVPDDDEPTPVFSLLLLEPAADLELIVGDSFSAAWTDQAEDANGSISVYLDPNDVDGDGNELLVASGIAEDPDDTADAVSVSTAAVPPGVYRVIGELVSGNQAVRSAAPGRVTVLPAGDYVLVIREPAIDVTVQIDDPLFVAWLDVNAERNAKITFYLDPDSTDLNGGEIWIGAFAEDPDGPGFDDAQIPIVNVPEGTYELLGVMFDGLVLTTARAPGQVTVVKVKTPTPDAPFSDCQPNGVPDGQELEGNDCNTNAQPDDCDIADGTSTDANSNGVPDSCEPRPLEYWRFKFDADPKCGDAAGSVPRTRYLAFDPDNHLIESWVLVDAACQGQERAYFRINYPSTGGPSFSRYDQACELTDNVSRTITRQEWGDPVHTVYIEELITVSDGDTRDAGTFALDGWITVTIDEDGQVSAVGMTGTWEHQSPQGDLLCGPFVAFKGQTPPDRPCIVDLEPTGLSLSTPNLASPGTVSVTDRRYRVRYSFLTEPVEIRYWLSASPEPGLTGPNVLLATDKIAAGPAGTLGPHAWPGPVLTIPAGLPASCDYYLVMEVDPGGTLEETDETNNAFAVPVTVSPDGASNCDPERFN